MMSFKDAPLTARYFRVTFTGLAPHAWASLRRFALYADLPHGYELPSYYRVMDDYRLRWEEVPYEPGTLEAVAYKNGEKIGTSEVRTAEIPAKLRLTPESTEFHTPGDLCYILAEVTDAKGTLCPCDMRKIHAEVQGPAEIVGIANGNPLGLDVFTDAEHPLFYGKAMILLRSTEKTGKVTLKVTAEGVAPAETVFP